MNIEERKQYVYNEALEELKEDNDIFVAACEELDSWDGFLGDDRVYNMEDFDELMSGKSPLEIARDIEDNNFSTSDDYFMWTIYGVESTDDKYDVYHSNYSEEAVLDELIDKYNHVSLYGNDRFDELVRILFEEDFGVDEEGEEETETDKEFKERIDMIWYREGERLFALFLSRYNI